jgi:hypothetical protein
MRRLALPFVMLATLAVSPVHSGAPSSSRRTLRLFRVSHDAPPADLSRPEGRTRWDLSGAASPQTFLRTLEAQGLRVAITEETPASGVQPLKRIFSDPSGGEAALDWTFPDRNPATLKMGTARDFVLEESSAGKSRVLSIHSEIVGIGWVHLPSRPYEGVLQRSLIQSEGPQGAAREIVYRWINNEVGVVAESRVPAGGGGPVSGLDAQVLDAVIEGADTLRIYTSQLWSPPFSDVGYGWDRTPKTCSVTTSTSCTKNADCPSGEFCSFPIASLTSPSYATMGDLLAPSTWDFSGNTSGNEFSGTTVNMSAAETCNSTQCGYTGAGAVLERTDLNWATPASTVKTNDVIELENRPTDTTIWVRGGSQKEGVSGSLGQGESRFCYITFGGVTRTPVPLYRFSHQDAPGQEYYMLTGDSWSSGVFNCEQNVFNQICGAAQFLDKLYSKNCTSGGGHAGTQSTAVVKGGVITTPSGHTFNALVLRVTADFCVYTGSSCLFAVDQVRTFNYLWQVPYIGTVVRLQSEQNAANGTGFTRVSETDIRFGLFPPRTIQTTGQTSTSVSLSWDPGLDTHRISGYKIYWDTDSGGSTAYAFNSVSNPAQVSIVGTTATVSGLTAGTTYYFTVTSLSNWTDPSTLVTSPFESLLYPTQVSGDPSFVYPVEVQAATTPATCIPAPEVTGVTVNSTATPGEIQICWTGVSDACLSGYRVLASSTANSDAGYAPAANVGSGQTCWTGSPAGTYFLVVANGTGGTGPWGHYGH